MKHGTARTPIICTACAVLFWASICHAYNDTVTHPTLVLSSAMNSGIGNVISGQLLLSAELESVFLSKSALTWLRDGARLEDDPACRASNHFHNPLNIFAWTNSNMNDMPWPIEWYCEVSDFATNHSALTWATGYLAPSPAGAKLATNNQWNWDRARFHYRQALTANTAAEREQAYALMFRALGQVLHLVQDMGVPAHARNDFMAHLKFAEINGVNMKKWFANPYEHYVKRNDALVALHPAVFPVFALQPGGLTDFWDTNRNSAGCATPSTRRSGRDLGLAEYTNANFLSDSTVFTEEKPCDDIRFFPHPRLDETDFNPEQLPVRIYNAEDGRADAMRLVSITDTEGLADWEAPTRAVAAVRYLARYLQEEDPSSFQYYERNFYLNPDDDAVHRDTAGRLLPRAVGYSAALLDYFFRGRIEPADAQTPLVVANSGSTITVRFRNASGEDMRDGTIELYQDNGEGAAVGSENRLVLLATLGFDWFVAGDSHSFENISVTIPPGKSLEDLVFTLVFSGQLGVETGAVVAKRFVGPHPPADLGKQVYTVGLNPMGIAITPDGLRLVVTNFGADTVSILDARGDQVLDTVAVGDGPYDVAIAKNGVGELYAFVSNYWSDSISVVDLGRHEVSGTFSGWPIVPRETAVGPDGRTIYTAHYTYAALSRIDADTMSFSWFGEQLPIERPMTGIALHPDQPLGYGLYYAFWWRKSAAVFNTQNVVKIADVDGPDLNRSGAVNNVADGGSGQYLYYVSRYVDQVSALDTTNNLPAPAIALAPGANPMRVNAGSDGRVYVTLYGLGKIAAINGVYREWISDFRDGDFAGPTDIAISPDNQYLYVTSTENNRVVRLPNPFLTKGAPAPQSALIARSACDAAQSATAIFAGVPYEAEIWVDERFPLHEDYQDGRQILAGIAPGEHQIAIVAPGYQRWSQVVSFVEGNTILTPALIAEP